MAHADLGVNQVLAWNGAEAIIILGRLKQVVLIEQIEALIRLINREGYI